MPALHSAEPSAGHRPIQSDWSIDGHHHNPIIPNHCPSAASRCGRTWRAARGMMLAGTGHDQRRSEESGASMGRHQAASYGDPMKMHAGEVDIDEALVTRLVVAQFPHLADLPIRA